MYIYVFVCVCASVYVLPPQWFSLPKITSGRFIGVQCDDVISWTLVNI